MSVFALGTEFCSFQRRVILTFDVLMLLAQQQKGIQSVVCPAVTVIITLLYGGPGPTLNVAKLDG